MAYLLKDSIPDIMGNFIYRASPKLEFKSEKGVSSYFKYGANQITGWRQSQEDRYICICNYYEDISFFGVYDGHGGEDVVQYLTRYLHDFIHAELEGSTDIELALYLGFLNCDSSLRSITDKEYAMIQKDIEKEFQLPGKEERRQFLFGVRRSPQAGSSEEVSDLRAAIANACSKNLRSISYLTEAPEEESDDSDEDYEPGDEDCNFLDKSAEKDESGGKDVSSHSFIMEEKSAEDSQFSEVSSSSIEDDSNILAEFQQNMEREEEKPTEDIEVMRRQFGVNCGSTATVLLINKNKVFIANVGDSRCVACLNGKAVDLTTDHRPTDTEERERIFSAGGTVSEEGRIEGDIDMSRAFGDLRYKPKDDPPLNTLSVEPSISVLDVTEDLEFLIVASDGIWNTMDSKDVIKYIQKYKDSMDLQDICRELFIKMLPQQVTADGSGCDNMSAIVINFFKTAPVSSNSTHVVNELYDHKVIDENQDQVPRCNTPMDSSKQIEPGVPFLINIADDDQVIIPKGNSTFPIKVIEDISSSSSSGNEKVEPGEISPDDSVIVVGEKSAYPIKIIKEIILGSSSESEIVELEEISPTNEGQPNLEPHLAAITTMPPNHPMSPQQSGVVDYQQDCWQPGQSNAAAQQKSGPSKTSTNENLKGMSQVLKSITDLEGHYRKGQSRLASIRVRLEKEISRLRK